MVRSRGLPWISGSQCVSKDQRLRCSAAGRALSGLAHAAGYLDRLLLDSVFFVASVAARRMVGGSEQPWMISASPLHEQGSAFTLLICWVSAFL